MAKSSKAKPAVDVAKLTKAQAKVELMRLALEIAGHDKRYYQDDAPTISDADYDALRQRVQCHRGAISRTGQRRIRRRRRSARRRPGASPRSGTRCRCCRSTTPSADEDVPDFVARIRRFLKLADDEIALHRRAQDRRPVAVAALRGRRAGHGRDARRRRRGRGRHRQYPHHRGHAAQAEGRRRARRSARCAARST